MADSKPMDDRLRATGGPAEPPIAITFDQPDVVSEIPDVLLDTWGGDPFLAIKTVGFFLRVVLPVQLEDGGEVHFGTWLEIHMEEWRTAWQTWNFPEYADLKVHGYLANVIEPWGKFPHVLIEASVRDLDEVPVLSLCPDEKVMRILRGTWKREYVLAPYADVLHSPAPAKSERRARSTKRARRLPEVADER